MRKTALTIGLIVLALATAVGAGTAITLPPFELPTLDGATITDLDLQGSMLLLFTIPDCEACNAGLQLVQVALAETSGVGAALVVPDASEAVREMVRTESVEWSVIVDGAFLLASILAIGHVPTVCLLQDGRLVGRLEHRFTADDLSYALEDPFENLEETSDVGALRDVNVAFMKLQEPLLLMFAGAECGFCHRMLPSVFEIAERFETVIVVTEELVDPEPFESDAARLSVLLDPNWELAQVFDVPTVPTVFFIDTDGTIVWSHTGSVEGLGIVADAVRQRTALE
ncbi:MAG: thioredoxin fold domain-containing protein [Candidatus Bipolaricaulia bacterium]